MVNKTKNGFTLAEVLITLVIIGIVAALTISAVINTYVERSTVAKVKKALSILAQAKKLAEAQNGSVIGWDYPEGNSAAAVSKFWPYLKPYISVAKDCGSNTDCYQTGAVTSLNGSDASYPSTNSNYYKIVLADGSVMWFRMPWTGGKCNSNEGGVDGLCALFSIDVNGNKSPNVIGKDVFLFAMAIDGVYPYMGDYCDKNSFGWSCSSYIIKHNNMNYLH